VLTNLAALVESLGSIALLDEHGECDLIEHALVNLVLDDCALLLGDLDGIVTVLKSLLLVQDVDDLDLGLEPQKHVRMLAPRISFEFSSQLFSFLS
jgi:hypothetical protein